MRRPMSYFISVLHTMTFTYNDGGFAVACLSLYNSKLYLETNFLIPASMSRISCQFSKQILPGNYRSRS